jgi:hypothetical protein
VTSGRARPSIAIKVPDDTMTAKPASRAGRCALSMPMAPKASVAMPPHTSHSPPKPAEPPASGENSSVDRRSST